MSRWRHLAPPPRTHARTRAGTRASSRRGGAWRWLAGICLLAACAPTLLWVVGQVTCDRWFWSQFLFWIPAPVGAVWGGLALLLLWRTRAWCGEWMGWGVLRWLTAAASIGALLITLTQSVGWRGWGTAAAQEGAGDGVQDGALRVFHWNVRVPGQRAPEYAAALAQVEAEVIILSNPGRLVDEDVAPDWVPPGWHMVDCRVLAVASACPVTVARVLAWDPSLSEGLWLVWLELELPRMASEDAPRPLRLLAVDLPSGLHIARAGLAERVRGILERFPELPPPDLLLGDFNNLPGSVVFDAFPPTRLPAHAARQGWMNTLPRTGPLWWIDLMRTGVDSPWQLQEYRTLDMGVGLHRAQRGLLRAPSSATLPTRDQTSPPGRRG